MIARPILMLFFHEKADIIINYIGSDCRQKPGLRDEDRAFSVSEFMLFAELVLKSDSRNTV